MSKNVRITIWVLVVIIVVGVICTLSNTSKENGVIKIGSPLSLTGNNAVYGQPTQRGMDLAVDEINKNGKKVEIIYEDEKSTTEGVVSSFQKLITIDKVPVTVGFMSSGGVLAAASIANESKVVLLSSLAGSDDIKNAGDYVFRIRESASTHGIEMAKYAKNVLGINKVAIYYANAANSISYIDYFRNEFTSLGGTFVFEGKYVEKSSDFRSDLTKIKNTKPDAIYLAGVAADMANILVQGKGLGIDAKWLASAGAESPKLVDVAKSAAEGLIFTTPSFNPDQKESRVESFVSAYKQKYGETPSFAAANGYDAVMLVYDVIKKNGYDSEKIKKGLYATKDYPGVGGTFSFDEFGEVQKPVMFKVVKNGQFVVLEK
jgi:branched-chain amino acid transport system substrate-binding protein